MRYIFSELPSAKFVFFIFEIDNKNLSMIDINYYSSLDYSYINDKMGYHKIKNGNGYTYSLHIYHPKNHITEYYD